MDSVPPSLPHTADAARTKSVGPFEVVDELGVGGMSRVFRARFRPHEGDPMALLPLERGEPVVIKMMRESAQQNQQQAEAFTKEADLLVMLDHPGLVRAHSRGIHENRVWIALEYIEGEHLGNIMYALKQRDLRMRPQVAAALIADLAEALAAAHALVDPRGRPLGLVHRDLSPANVMIDIHGRVRLVDFGTAVLSAQENTRGHVIGTPGYLSPEHARAETLNPASDVYSMGVIFYELLAGRRAFPLESLPDDAILKAHAAGTKPRWPSQMPIPAEFKDVCDLLLDPDPTRRPQTAGNVFHLVAPLVDDFDESRRALAVTSRDLVKSNRDRPPPLFV